MNVQKQVGPQKAAPWCCSVFSSAPYLCGTKFDCTFKEIDNHEHDIDNDTDGDDDGDDNDDDEGDDIEWQHQLW